MSLKKVMLVAAVAMLALTPFLVTGCGTDDTTSDKAIGIYTVGPGNLTAEELANIPVVKGSTN